MSTREFSFPLNVYARLLELREGGCDYLHFAVFERPDEAVRRAQERASELLWQALPPPGKLLEVGIGLGTTLSRLKAAGHDAVGITPELAQMHEAVRRHGADLPLRCSRLEDFAEDEGRWQTLLFQESAQYIAPLALFGAAERLMTRGPASLVVMDEFALRRRDAGDWGLHHLGHFMALAQRFGWRLTQHTDLSNAVQPTLQYLLRALADERGRLLADLDLRAQDLDELQSALQRSLTQYRQGRFGYALLRWQRESPPEVAPSMVGAGDALAVGELFAQVFGRPLPEREWQWKYGQGRGQAVALKAAGRLSAHYGGLTRRVWHEGREVVACQVCDVMVQPDLHRHLARKGPLQQVTASFLEAQIGWGLPHLIGFGFPTRRAFAVAQRLGLYAAVDEMDCVHWPATQQPSAGRLHSRVLDAAALGEGSATAARVGLLWQRMRDSLSACTLGVRDAAWLRHRYVDHPHFDYEIHLLRSAWWRRPLGVVVLRPHERHLEWLDVVAPPSAWPHLLAFVRARAGALGRPAVEAWITRSQRPLFEALADDSGWRTLDIEVPSNQHSPGPAPEQLRDRWLLMAGDTDFR